MYMYVVALLCLVSMTDRSCANAHTSTSSSNAFEHTCTFVLYMYMYCTLPTQYMHVNHVCTCTCIHSWRVLQVEGHTDCSEDKECSWTWLAPHSMGGHVHVNVLIINASPVSMLGSHHCITKARFSIVRKWRPRCLLKEIQYTCGGGKGHIYMYVLHMYAHAHTIMQIHVHVNVHGRALTAKVRGPRFNPGWLPGFHSSLKIFPSLSSCMYM